MRKKVIILFLMVGCFLYHPIFSTAWGTYQSPESTCDGNSSCFGGMGIQISIMKYDGSGTPRVVGKPLLIRNDALWSTKTYFTGGGYPATYDDFDNYGIYIYQWQSQNFVDELGYINRIDYYCKSGHETSNNGKDDKPGPVTSGYQENVQIFYTNHRIVTYSPNGITGLEKYHKIIVDNSLPSDAVALARYIGDKNGGKVKDLTDSIDKIRENFGARIDYAEIDKYYISVELVQRVRGGIYNEHGSFLVNRVSTFEGGPTPPTEPGVYDNWEKVWKSKTTCKNVCEDIDGSITCNRTCETKTVFDGWKIDYPECDGIKDAAEFYGKYADGYSYLATARELQAQGKTSYSYLCKLQDNIYENAHCELENDNVTCRRDSRGNIIYQYYIGPSLEKGLVGTGNHNYLKFNQNSCSTNLKNASGIKNFYLEDFISCSNACNGLSGDTLLACAENYCDAQVDFDLKGNAQKRKSACILSCNYTYGTDPTGRNDPSKRESVNSCNNASPYKTIANKVVATNSTCGIDGAGNPLLNNLAVTTSCIGDHVTDFDGDDTNDTVFDQRKYINIACKETSGVGFVNLTGMQILAGTGIDYWSKLSGEKECTAYFNLEQWKFDYATISSKDPDRRKRLLYIYNVYNNALNNGYDKTRDPYYDRDFEEENDGEINWSDYEYDISKVSMISEVREIVNNTVKNSVKYNLVVRSDENSVNATITEKENVRTIQNMNVRDKIVNRYVQTSKVQAYYTFDKYCVSNDGKATIYQTPANGICYMRGSGSDAIEVLGRNVYYTNLNATRNKDFSREIINRGLGHAVSTDVTIGKEVKDNNFYYQDGEHCPYKIDGENLQCTIVITNNEGTIMHGNDIYVKGGVTATLKVKDRLGVEDKVKEVGLALGKTRVVNGATSLDIGISDQRNGVEKIDITGAVTTENGAEVICSKQIHIIDPSPACGVSCSVEKTSNELLYEIKSPETGNTTQTQRPSSYQTALSTNMNWVKVLPDISTNKYLVRLHKKLGNEIGTNNMTLYNETIVYGKVLGTMSDGSACYNVCWSDPPELPNCKANYDPADSTHIKNHCERYWDKDINNYESYSDCINSCSSARMCPDNKADLGEVTTVCGNNYNEWGFTNASSCVNYCYYCPECSSDYLYRSVNNYNPFPNSSDSNSNGFTYPSGNRIIPANWIGKTLYIKKDTEDQSSVTGTSHTPEYVIDLTPADIKAIRADTESYNKDEGNDAYLDYVYMDGVDKTKTYYSKFINDSFSGLFTYVRGERK